MKLNNIKFRIAAYTSEAARENNEDTYFVDDNLSDDVLGQFTTDEVVKMNDNGILLMVADGMGGMNAGEVASAIASDTVKARFEKEKIVDIIGSPSKIRKYIEETIVLADSNIKEEGRKDPDKAGMGSTIVLMWIVNDVAYVGWCGDSRAYCFNKVNGLVRLSHDHSYVQELVDAGKIDEEVAIYHPDSNIITRSLGDPRKAAKPDVKEFPVHNGDIFLLCSDGLCGVLQDREIEGVMRNDYQELSDMRKALWKAAELAGWHDNVTTVLCEIVAGGEKPEKKTDEEPANCLKDFFTNKKTITMSAIITALVIVIGCMAVWIGKINKEHNLLKDNEAFNQCKDVNDFRNYLKNFPNGNNVDKANETIELFVADSTAKLENVNVEGGNKEETTKSQKVNTQSDGKAPAASENDGNKGNTNLLNPIEGEGKPENLTPVEDKPAGEGIEQSNPVLQPTQPVNPVKPNDSLNSTIQPVKNDSVSEAGTSNPDNGSSKSEKNNDK